MTSPMRPVDVSAHEDKKPFFPRGADMWWSFAGGLLFGLLGLLLAPGSWLVFTVVTAGAFAAGLFIAPRVRARTSKR